MLECLPYRGNNVSKDTEVRKCGVILGGIKAALFLKRRDWRRVARDGVGQVAWCSIVQEPVG